jgi:hypothetical protein
VCGRLRAAPFLCHLGGRHRLQARQRCRPVDGIIGRQDRLTAAGTRFAQLLCRGETRLLDAHQRQRLLDRRHGELDGGDAENNLHQRGASFYAACGHERMP